VIVQFREGFVRDLSGVRDKAILERVKKLILTVEGSHALRISPTSRNCGAVRISIGSGWVIIASA
jgi:hypothetical protein